MRGEFPNVILIQGHKLEELRPLVLVAMFIDLFKFCSVLAHLIFPVCLLRYILCMYQISTTVDF